MLKAVDIVVQKAAMLADDIAEPKEKMAEREAWSYLKDGVVQWGTEQDLGEISIAESGTWSRKGVDQWGDELIEGVAENQS